MVQWYHTQLCHPGTTRTEETIRQHFTWKGLRPMVKEICSSCHSCQINKRQSIKYGKLPVKEEVYIPWEVLCVDLIGPYTIKQPNKENITLWAITMIDPATNWFEIKEIKTKRADVIANLVEQIWLTRYPWPTKVITDRGTEILAEFAQLIKDEYGIEKKLITTRNPQANSILERIHQTIGNMIRTFEVHNNQLDEDDPWSGILAAIAFATRATIHTTLQQTPSQLVFGRDAILNISHQANWKIINNRKRKLIEKNNLKENRKRKTHVYHVNDLCLIKQDWNKKYDPSYKCPYTITKVNNNVTVNV